MIDVLKILCIGANYDPRFLSVKTTCKTKLESHQNANKSECETLCNNDKNCRFIFHAYKSMKCDLYQLCEETRIGGEIGSTYAKSKCSGTYKTIKFPWKYIL